MAGAASVAQALPAPEQVVGQKRAETTSDHKAQLASLTRALQQYADGPPPASSTTAAKSGSNINTNAAMVGAAIGAVLGGTVGAYLPLNTTFTTNSILQGITSEIARAMAIGEDAGLNYITSMIPILGTILAEQPNLGRGPKDQQGPYIPPPFPSSNATAGVASDPKSTEESENKPKGDGTAEIQIAPPPVPGPPKPSTADKPSSAEVQMAPPPVPGPPKPSPADVQMAPPHAAGPPKPSAGDSERTTGSSASAKGSSKEDSPGLEATQPVATPAATPEVAADSAPGVAHSMNWISWLRELGGHIHVDERRR
ncbi:hypothetical protein E2P81_ATG05580 [Venturia nashicola]|nr:hypothetical protein E2P81_ATG05580 [Venturia nashicola]